MSRNDTNDTHEFRLWHQLPLALESSNAVQSILASDRSATLDIEYATALHAAIEEFGIGPEIQLS